MAITAQQKANLLGVTSFMFNFAPDQASFARFEAIIEANPSFYALGTNLARTEAYTSQFAEGATRAEKIDLILGRLGLTEGEGYERGVDFINQRLDAGIPEGQVLMEIGEKLLQDTPPTGLEDAAAILKNKIAASEAYLESGIVGYSSETLPDLLANITADAASVEAAQAAIDAIKPGVPGESFMLTVGTDTLVGTDGNDVFNAGLEFVQDGGGRSEFQTLNDGDIIDGGEGFDRLNAVLNGTNGPDGDSSTTTPESITNVEQFFLRARAEDDIVFNAANVEGAEQFWNDRSTRDLTVDDVQNSVVMGLNAVRGGTTYALNYDDAITDPTQQTIVTQGAGTATSAVTLNVGEAALNSLTIDAAGGFNNLDLADGFDNVRNLTITGSAALILTGAAQFADIESVAAADYTGDLDLDISAADLQDNETNVVLGAGDNRLAIGGDTLGDEVSIDLGEGYNTLAIGALEDFEGLNDADVSGVNALEIGASALVGAQTLDLAEFDSEIDQFIVGGALDVDVNTLTIEGGQSDFTVTVDANIEAGVAGAINFDGIESLTINVTEDATTAGEGEALTVEGEDLESLTLVDSSDDGDATFNLVIGDSAVNLTSIDLTGLEGGLAQGQEEIDLENFVTTYSGASATIDASGVEFEGAVSITIGTGRVDYTATGEAREVFQFVGDDIFAVEIDSFDNGSGSNRDRLDFSQFDGVSSTEDLSITYAGTTATITSDAFTGIIELELAGVGAELQEVDFVF